VHASTRFPKSAVQGRARFNELWKAKGISKLMIPTVFFYSESPDRIRRAWRRDFQIGIPDPDFALNPSRHLANHWT